MGRWKRKEYVHNLNMTKYFCREEFKTFSKKKKEKCLICGRIVCSTCHASTLPVKGAVDGIESMLP